MRLIFYSLLLIVLGYFAWCEWGESWYVALDEQASTVVQMRKDVTSLVLLSERPEEAKLLVDAVPVAVSTSVKEIVEPALLPKPVIAPTKSPVPINVPGVEEALVTPAESLVVICREFGPFAAVDEAQRFRQVIGVGGEVVDRQVRKASVYWLVVSSSAGEGVRTTELNTFLVQQGLFISRPALPGLQGESAVGPFVSEQVAQSYQRRLKEIGVATRELSEEDGKQEYWLRSEFKMEQLPIVLAAFNGYLSGSQAQSIAQFVCN